MWTFLRRISLTQWILIAMALGIVYALWARSINHPEYAQSLRPISTTFLRMIKSIIAPIIFGTLVVGIAGHGDDMKRVGRLALKSLIYFEIVTTLALFIGLLAVNIVKPGVGVVLPPIAGTAPVQGEQPTLASVLMKIPTRPEASSASAVWRTWDDQRLARRSVANSPRKDARRPSNVCRYCCSALFDSSGDGRADLTVDPPCDQLDDVGLFDGLGGAQGLLDDAAVLQVANAQAVERLALAGLDVLVLEDRVRLAVKKDFDAGLHIVGAEGRHILLSYKSMGCRRWRNRRKCGRE